MPVHGRPYEKGNLYIHFNVKFPDPLEAWQVMRCAPAPRAGARRPRSTGAWTPRTSSRRAPGAAACRVCAGACCVCAGVLGVCSRTRHIEVGWGVLYLRCVLLLPWLPTPCKPSLSQHTRQHVEAMLIMKREPSAGVLRGRSRTWRRSCRRGGSTPRRTAARRTRAATRRTACRAGRRCSARSSDAPGRRPGFRVCGARCGDYEERGAAA